MQEICLLATYIVQVRLMTQLLKATYKHYFANKTMCIRNFVLYNKFYQGTCCCLNFFSYFLAYFLVSAKMWLAKRPSCPAISCSWAATRLASTVAFLISLAFFLTIFPPFLSFRILFSSLLFLLQPGNFGPQSPLLGTAAKAINPPQEPEKLSHTRAPFLLYGSIKDVHESNSRGESTHIVKATTK